MRGASSAAKSLRGLEVRRHLGRRLYWHHRLTQLMQLVIGRGVADVFHIVPPERQRNCAPVCWEGRSDCVSRIKDGDDAIQYKSCADPPPDKCSPSAVTEEIPTTMPARIAALSMSLERLTLARC